MTEVKSKNLPKITSLKDDPPITGQSYASLAVRNSRDGVCFKVSRIFVTESETKDWISKIKRKPISNHHPIHIVPVGRWTSFDTNSGNLINDSKTQLRQMTNYVHDYNRTISNKEKLDKVSSERKITERKLPALSIDKLNKDESKPGQNYVCVSFVTPAESRTPSLLTVKIRGVADTLEQANILSANLVKDDPDYDVIVAKMGEWQTWTNWITDEPTDIAKYNESLAKIYLKGHQLASPKIATSKT